MDLSSTAIFKLYSIIYIENLLLVERIPLSIETESDGSPHKPQFLISIGFPRVLTNEYLSVIGILFY